MSVDVMTLDIPEKEILTLLQGHHFCHLHTVSDLCGVDVGSRGHAVFFKGEEDACQVANDLVMYLYVALKGGAMQDITPQDIYLAYDMVADKSLQGATHRHINKAQLKKGDGHLSEKDEEVSLQNTLRSVTVMKGRVVQTKTKGQSQFLEALDKNPLVFALGPAGTGKTYLAVCYGLALLLLGKVKRLVLSRPAVAAGESLGYLPGDMKEKIDPYLRPIYDILHEFLPPEQIQNYLKDQTIEIAPLAFMRGRTLKECFVILDEAQNTTPMQMKMFLTRFGEHGRMVVTGDVSQKDVQGLSGLQDAVDRLAHIKDISIIKLTSKDVMRHPLVREIIKAYDGE